MSRKKNIEGPKGLAPWMATFSDLMNLLLCFFVLLFSMSSIDEEKWNEVVASLQASFSIFDGGATAISEGNLISSGVSQLNDLNDYFDDMGYNTQDSNSVIESLGEYKQQMEELQNAASQELGEKVQQMLEDEGIAEQVSVEITTQYVQMTLNGAILFDPTKAEIRKDAINIVSKMGDILKYFKDNTIKIVGHTDNIPQVSDTIYTDNNLLSYGRAYSIMKYLISVKGMEPNNMECAGRGEYEPIADNNTEQGRALNRRVEIRLYNEYSEE